jgi:hypothetical protein
MRALLPFVLALAACRGRPIAVGLVASEGDRRPIPGIRVVCERDGPPRTGTTDERGGYLVPGPCLRVTFSDVDGPAHGRFADRTLAWPPPGLVELAPAALPGENQDPREAR